MTTLHSGVSGMECCVGRQVLGVGMILESVCRSSLLSTFLDPNEGDTVKVELSIVPLKMFSTDAKIQTATTLSNLL